VLYAEDTKYTFAGVDKFTDEMERRLRIRIKGASPYGFRLIGGRGQPVSVTKVASALSYWNYLHSSQISVIPLFLSLTL